MTVASLSIDGSFLLEHKVFPDERGLFREWYKAEDLKRVAPDFEVAQANNSNSIKGVIRGIHYSVAPEGQAKLVMCSFGKIVDVLVDLRIGSPTYKKIAYIELNPEEGRVVYIPSGVGHGFVVESDHASVVYLTSSAYAPEFEKVVNPMDGELGVRWVEPGDVGLLLSEQDRNAPTLAEAFAAGNLPQY